MVGPYQERAIRPRPTKRASEPRRLRSAFRGSDPTWARENRQTPLLRPEVQRLTWWLRKYTL